MEWSQRFDEPAQVGGRARVANIQIVGYLRTAMEGCRKTADYNEVDACVAQSLNGFFELHQERERAVPRTRSSTIEAASNFLARSAGVSRNCSTSSVKSTP